MIMPYCAAALLWKRKDPQIRATYTDIQAFYHPSLWFLTWLTRADLFGLVWIMSTFLLRLALRYEVIDGAPAQPYWSLLLSAIASLILLMLLALPATFLFTVKHWIETDRELGAGGRLRNTESAEYTGRDHDG